MHLLIKRNALFYCIDKILYLWYNISTRGQRTSLGEKMKRKTYNNVLKAGRLIQKKGYSEKEALEMAVKCFDNLAEMNNGMPVEWLIEKIADKTK